MGERRKGRGESQLIAFCFAAEDERALALVYSEAAQDPEFQVDNEAVQQDFAALDDEADAEVR